MGESLPEIFEEQEGAQDIAPRLKQEIELLLSENFSNEYFDEVLYGQWRAGYEPDEGEGETWADALHQIRDLCEIHSDN